MENIEQRKANMKWLSEGSTHQVFIKHPIIKTEIFDNNNAILLYEDCLVDLYRTIEIMQKQINDLNSKNNIVENKNVVIKKRSLLN